MKVLFIHHGTGIGGAPINLINLIKILKERGVYCKVGLIKSSDVEVLLYQNNIEYDIINSSNIYFLHNSSDLLCLNIFKYLKILLSWIYTVKYDIRKYLNKNMDYDIVHLGSHGLSNWAYAAFKLNFKVVIHNQETVVKGLLGFRRQILRSLLKNYTNSIIDISYFNKGRLGIVGSNVVYNFLDIPKSYRIPFSSNEVKVLYLGGSAKIKGFKIAVDCLDYLNDNITIQFAGSLNSWNKPNSFKERIINTLKLTLYRSSYLPMLKLSRSKNAKIIGLLENPYKFIDNCDILITPFTVEHFSRPAIEAFAFGKPVIASSVEGMDEIIEHGVNGLLFEKNNARDLAEAINYLAVNQLLAREMGKNGRKKAEEVFSAKVNVNKVMEIYSSLMGQF